MEQWLLFWPFLLAAPRWCRVVMRLWRRQLVQQWALAAAVVVTLRGRHGGGGAGSSRRLVVLLGWRLLDLRLVAVLHGLRGDGVGGVLPGL